MIKQDNVTQKDTKALLFAAIGVLGFSGTLPATRLAAPYLGATQVGLGRALIAALCAIIFLTIVRAPRPQGDQWPRLLVVSAGVVIGFPWLTAWALHFTTAGRAAIIVALAPLFTALIGALRERERPGLGFWLSSSIGSGCVMIYLAASPSVPTANDHHEWGILPELALGAATLLAACAYTEGARLTKELGGLQVISWALVISLPFVLPIVILQEPHFESVPWSAWFGLAYVSLISMFGAFYFWYSGLSGAGVMRASQVQLIQPMLSVLWAFLFLAEPMSAGLLFAALGTVASVAWGIRQTRPGRRINTDSLAPMSQPASECLRL